MIKTIRCQAQGGPESCTSSRCPDRIYHVSGRARKTFASTLTEFLGGRSQTVLAVGSSDAGEAAVLPRVGVPSFVGEITATTDGQLRVLSKDYESEDGQAVYLFGDLTTDVEDARRLDAADGYKQYQNGECGGLAGELWNLNRHVEEYYYFAVPEAPVWGTHHFVKLVDGTYADSLGIWTEESLLATWRAIDPGISLQIFEKDKPRPRKNRRLKPSNPELYGAVSGLIEKRFR